LAVAGLLDLSGRIVQAPNLPLFVDHDLRGTVSRALGVPVVMDNDVNAALYGEHRAGAARGARHVAMLSLGTGVGGGLLLEGHLYRGAGGTGAELGHTLLDFEGPVCPCGQKGHVESYLSTSAIVDHARRRLEEAGPAEGEVLREKIAEAGKISPRVLGAAADAQDAVAQAILADAGTLLGIACASIVNAFNPEIVVIGGGVAGCGEHLLGPARDTLAARAMPHPGAIAKLVPAELGPDGAALGAAYLALDARATLDAGQLPGD
jgi:glucokinase